MALVIKFHPQYKERISVHEPVECGYTMFEQDGKKYLQLDTYGSSARQIPGKTSQSIQLDAASAARLKRLLSRAFPEIK